MRYFDPSENIRGIQQLLVSDKKKIAFLLGAGVSFSKKNDKSPCIPGVDKMTEVVVEALKSNDKHYSATREIKSEIEANNCRFNIESLLSNVVEKKNVVGNGFLNGLDKIGFSELETAIRKEIYNLVSIHKQINETSYDNMTQYDFASWIKSADRKFAIEIFTTNYDYIIEMVLERHNIPYYDGFTGSFQPFFNSESVEDLDYLPRQTKLWKIHGSLGLKSEKETNKIIRLPLNNDEDLLIYPSALKYSNSKKQPYAAFMDRLNLFLKQDDAVLFVFGYSFGDEHINERILSALNSNATTHIFIFLYDIIRDGNSKKHSFTEESPLAKLAKTNRKISILASRSAVIGAQFGVWSLKREPDKQDSLNVQWYFDEDAPINKSIPIQEERKGDEEWTGRGELVLVDFAKFTEFLQRMLPVNYGENYYDKS